MKSICIFVGSCFLYQLHPQNYSSLIVYNFQYVQSIESLQYTKHFPTFRLCYKSTNLGVSSSTLTAKKKNSKHITPTNTVENPKQSKEKHNIMVNTTLTMKDYTQIRVYTQHQLFVSYLNNLVLSMSVHKHKTCFQFELILLLVILVFSFSVSSKIGKLIMNISEKLIDCMSVCALDLYQFAGS